jgi:hypothetical protein
MNLTVRSTCLLALKNALGIGRGRGEFTLADIVPVRCGGEAESLGRESLISTGPDDQII